MIRAVLFDLDGTLADTALDLAGALNRLRAEHRMAPLPPERTRAHTSGGARGLLKVGFDLEPGDERYVAMRDRFLDLYAEALCVHTQLYAGMAELLGELDRRTVAWGIVTNKPRRFTDPLLHAAGVMRIAPQACLYVGDDLRDVQGARAAGMPVIAAGWGYLGEGGDPASWGADAVVAHPAEVLGFLD